uniref:YqaJ viral recombinase domain-containing protein n=1 Tax=Amphimedon queenslandica TaxID=400682 RepID=A0A1X7VJ44_AMPQE
MRAGRVPASNFKSVSHTNESSLFLSLILSMCHSETSKFRNNATAWGIQHEKVARDKYSSYSGLNHVDFKMEECGFFIDVDNPYIGASPDGVVSCVCCGDDVCEIKCPFCHKDDCFKDAVKDTNFCLAETDNGNYELKHSHSYYYQIAHLSWILVNYVKFLAQ